MKKIAMLGVVVALGLGGSGVAGTSASAVEPALDGVKFPVPALTPAMSGGVHRAELHDFERDYYDPMIDRVCFFDRQQKLGEAQALDPTAYATDCDVERSPERSYSWYFIVWPNAEAVAAR